jgi:hypothetical protein
LKLFQIVESMWWLWISRLFTGQEIGVISFIAALEWMSASPTNGRFNRFSWLRGQGWMQAGAMYVTPKPVPAGYR